MTALKAAHGGLLTAGFVNGPLTSGGHAAAEPGQVSAPKHPDFAMKWPMLDARTGTMAAAFLAGLACAAAGTLAVKAAPQFTVSQKGRAFQPGEIALRRGQAIVIINDDADLLHHAYIDAENFKFDSGDQEPGSKTTILFKAAGTFNVLCAIHPKMKLIVRVE